MKFFRLLNLALQFTTRIPGIYIKNFDEKEMGESGVLFPIIGLLVGFILFFEYEFLHSLNIIALSILIVVTEMLISGGLHLDGYMDTMDGMMSGATGEKMLSIMADSNVGAHGVTMVISLILAKIAFLISVINQEPVILVTLPFIGRIIMVLCILIFPYAKKEGIGIIYKKYLNKKLVLLSGVIYLFILFAIRDYLIFSFFLTFVVILYFAKRVTSKIGGLTGDVYGAIEEISEVIFLMFTFLILSR